MNCLKQDVVSKGLRSKLTSDGGGRKKSGAKR